MEPMMVDAEIVTAKNWRAAVDATLAEIQEVLRHFGGGGTLRCWADPTGDSATIRVALESSDGEGGNGLFIAPTRVERFDQPHREPHPPTGASSIAQGNPNPDHTVCVGTGTVGDLKQSLRNAVFQRLCDAGLGFLADDDSFFWADGGRAWPVLGVSAAPQRAAAASRP
jgi:hypothetical protein